MAFELVGVSLELGEDRRHRRFERNLLEAGGVACGLGDRLRRANAGDDVFALRIDEIFAVELAHAGRRIAREGDAGRRLRAHIAKHHRLNIDRGAPAFGNVVQAAIDDGAIIHPGGKHRLDRAPQLLARILRKALARGLFDDRLVLRGDLAPIVGRQLRIEREALALLDSLQRFLELVMFDAEHDAGIHFDEASVAVPGEAFVAGIARERFHGLVVETEIEHRVHHPGH